MPALTTERKELLELIDVLHDEDVEKVISYAAYLSHLEAQEETEDAAYIEAHKDSPSIPLEDALRELGI